ncbi:MAG: hypothetical protein IT214_07475 [Chitinophagaceae bacterium]|nr:hypothetical protein [Chitinophagaceae bacterium]
MRRVYRAILLFLLFTHLCHQTYSQVLNDSLAKYSYLLFGFLNQTKQGEFIRFYPWQATGFFIKKEKRVFLVSVKHALSPCKFSNGIDYDKYPDNFFIRLSNNKEDLDLYSVETKLIRDTVKCFTYYYEDPDIFIIELIGLDSSKLNCI